MKNIALIVIGIIVLALMVFMYGNMRVANAKAKASRDSLMMAKSRHEVQVAERDSTIESQELLIGAWKEERVELDRELVDAKNETAESNHRFRSLRAKLAEDSSAVTAEEVAERADDFIAALHEENRICISSLLFCDSSNAAKDLIIISQDSTIAEKDELLDEFNVQLGDAIKRANPGFLKKLLPDVGDIPKLILVFLVGTQVGR